MGTILNVAADVVLSCKWQTDGWDSCTALQGKGVWAWLNNPIWVYI